MTRFRCLSAFIALFSCALHINVSAEEWQQIPVPASVEIINDEGQPQTLSPACALETITDPATGAVIPNDFHFYFKTTFKHLANFVLFLVTNARAPR